MSEQLIALQQHNETLKKILDHVTAEKHAFDKMHIDAVKKVHALETQLVKNENDFKKVVEELGNSRQEYCELKKKISELESKVGQES
jgi:hypothetical protein